MSLSFDAQLMQELDCGPMATKSIGNDLIRKYWVVFQCFVFSRFVLIFLKGADLGFLTTGQVSHLAGANCCNGDLSFLFESIFSMTKVGSCQISCLPCIGQLRKLLNKTNDLNSIISTDTLNQLQSAFFHSKPNIT